MYNILTFDNGQPFILYQESEKIFMYTIARGRITAKSLPFNNVKSNFQVFNCTPAKIYYISTDNRLNDSLNELAAQYNELADYAGTLQEELRKTRYYMSLCVSAHP